MTGFQHLIPGGAAWSWPVRAGRPVTFTAQGPDAVCSVLMFGPDRLDRLNLPDTLKAQMRATISAPMVLMSDRGFALASVVSSSLDWHDALTGLGHPRHLERFGASSYQADRNGWRRSPRTGVLSELTKHGLGEADLHGCVNFFAKVALDEERAGLSFVAGHSAAGDTVTLRTELDLLLVCATGPHPLEPRDYAPAAVEVSVDIAAPLAHDDPCWTFRDESRRALEQSARTLV